MTDLSFRLKDLENKERHIDCVLPADMILDALADMDIDVCSRRCGLWRT